MPTAAQAVAAFHRYIGHPYVWGGWDCSGAVNHVIGQVLGLPIPGTSGPGSSQRGYTGPPPHGPVVSDWLNWDGCVTVPGPPKPGDLEIYGPDVHIGMATSATQYLSALDPTLGTQVTPITSGPTGNPTYRRVKALGLGGVLPITPVHHRAGAASSALVRLLLLGGVAAGAVLAVAAGVALVTSGGAAAGAGYLASRRRRTSADF